MLQSSKVLEDSNDIMARLEVDVQGRYAEWFSQGLCMQVLMKLAEARNSKPLPKFRTR